MAAGEQRRFDRPRSNQTLTGMPKVTPPADPEERWLQAMAAMEGKLLAQIADANAKADRAQQLSIRPHPEQRGEKGDTGKAASWVQQMPAIIVAVAGLITAFGAFTKKDNDDSAKVYVELKAAVEKNGADNAKTSADVEALRQWLGGFAKALPGVKVNDPPGAKPVPALELEPAPTKGSHAPPVQVREPLPPPAVKVKPVVLPSPEELFGAKKP